MSYPEPNSLDDIYGTGAELVDDDVRFETLTHTCPECVVLDYKQIEFNNLGAYCSRCGSGTMLDSGDVLTLIRQLTPVPGNTE